VDGEQRARQHGSGLLSSNTPDRGAMAEMRSASRDIERAPSPARGAAA